MKTSIPVNSAVVKKEPGADVDLEDQLLAAIKESSDDGIQQNAVSDKLPQYNSVQILSTVNRLLAKGLIELLQNAEGDIIYKYKVGVLVNLVILCFPCDSLYLIQSYMVSSG